MTSFYDGLKLRAYSFRLNVPRSFSRLGNGQVIPQALGFAYWSGSVQIAPDYHAPSGEYEARLMGLDRPGQTFLVYDTRYNGPVADPGGALLADVGAVPQLHTVSSDNQSIRLSGLPASYVITPGDYIGWITASGTHVLHRARTGAQASGAGLTPIFAVEPLVAPGTVTGAAVSLVRPTCRAIVTRSSYGNGAPLITSGAGFDWQEARR